MRTEPIIPMMGNEFYIRRVCLLSLLPSTTYWHVLPWNRPRAKYTVARGSRCDYQLYIIVTIRGSCALGEIRGTADEIKEIEKQ